ncbi:hypothetical protein LH450_03600 [Laribacter hongkongensis]|uniref:hypothetical protein n=1 Tax=Laribacter hongkongensis TaxID=168471 RepID=UPI001EFE4790|nr:hypothetical protein [Laribacter hongkongensis]MCG9000245.1 hypothetical protein [Laribacter hongkongensis]MCG9006635.1 hypothetical protein [Laribacter hongkongensis]MCG9015695.1 hypothetical protein [Laribacter hongkongensis]
MVIKTLQLPVEKERALICAVRNVYSGARSGLQPSIVTPYFSAGGDLLFAKVRYDAVDGKWIRPFFYDGDRWRLGEPDFSQGKKPILNLPLLLENPDAEVWLVEGEKSAASLTDVGVLATTSGGATSIGGADWIPLAGRNIVVWPDFDEAGQEWLADAIDVLHGIAATLRVVDVDKLQLGEGDDVADWLPGQEVAALARLPLIDACQLLPAASLPETSDEKISMSTVLVEFVQQNCNLFRNLNGEVFARLNGSNQAWRLASAAFRDWLFSSFYRETGKAPRDQAVKDALTVLTGIGLHEGELREAHFRVAEHDGKYFIDPGDDSWNVIEISAEGWRVSEQSPVLFVRTKTMRPLPEPIRGGCLDALWPCINVPEGERPLVLAWLLECLRPDTPYPLLELSGEQGSAKSTTQSYLRRLIDPNHVNLRAAPRKCEDIFVSAATGLLVSYENLSYLSPEKQDAFCTLATGGGFARRQLYTDAEESTIEVKRPVVLNGIAAVVTAQDLVSRTISIELPTIRARATGAELEAKFGAEHGRLLGALLDLFVATLRALPDVSLAPERRPRMADFCLLGMAMMKARGCDPEQFVELYRKSEVGNVERTLDASPVATAVRELLHDQPEVRCTLKELLAQLERYRPSRCESWPRSPKGLAAALKRAAAALRMVGINVCEDVSVSRRSGQWWRLERQGVQGQTLNRSAQSSQSSPAYAGDPPSSVDVEMEDPLLAAELEKERIDGLMASLFAGMEAGKQKVNQVDSKAP